MSDLPEVGSGETYTGSFDMGVERIAPPLMPTSNVRMMPWILVAFFLYLAGNFYLFIELAVNSQNGWPIVVQVLSIIINLVALIVGLVLSYIAVLRIVRGDQEASFRYPGDQAMANWNRLYQCSPYIIDRWAMYAIRRKV